MTAEPRAPAAHPWEAHYPPGVRWDAPVVRGTVGALFAQAVARHADRDALEYQGVALSYAALGRRAFAVANALMAEGFGPGGALALYLPNTAYHPFCFFGALSAGGRVAHLSPLDPPRVLAHKLGDSGAETLVTANLPAMLATALGLLDAGHVKRVIVCDEAAFGTPRAALAPLPDRPDVIAYDRFVAGAAETAPEDRAGPDDVALLQYTGGTTGLPKGAMLTHGNLTSAVSIYDAWYAGFGEPEGREAVLCVLPLFHIYALTTVLLRQLKEGATILIRMRFDAARTLDDIEAHRVTVFAGVPTMWIGLTNFPGVEGRDLSSLRLCASGGAPLPVEVGRRFAALTGHELLGGWGMTETSPAGTNIPVGFAAKKPGTVGVPLPRIEMKIVDLEDPARDLGPGETGEIAVRGPNVTPGYWNQPEATAQAFHGDWFLTGDVGSVDEDGFFYLVDRKSDMILSGGFNVYPQMVEQAIYEHPAVAEAMVIGVPDAYRGESAKAYVTLRDGAAPFSLDDLRAFLDGRVGRHEMPRDLEFRDTLPRTPVGKLSRKMLKDEEAARRDAQAQREATAT